METRAKAPAEFMLFIPNPRISHPKQTVLPEDVFFIYHLGYKMVYCAVSLQLQTC